jgi:hypothetical protein
MGKCHRSRQLAELGDYLENIHKVRWEFCRIPEYIFSNALLREIMNRRWVSVTEHDSMLSKEIVWQIFVMLDEIEDG